MKIFGFEIKRASKESSEKKRELFSSIVSFFNYSDSVISDSDLSTQLRCYKSWVYPAATLNATSVAQVPLRLYVAKPKPDLKSRFPTKKLDPIHREYILRSSYLLKSANVRRATEIEEIVDHPILDLLSSVNNFNNGFDLWEITQLHQELAGNAYWFLPQNRLGLPQEIWVIPPDRIRVALDNDNLISGYVYNYGTTRIYFKESEIIHFKMPNSYDMVYGRSPLLAVASAYNTNESMHRYETALFKNMGRLSGAFETSESLSDEDFARLKEELRAAFTSVDNVGKAPLLDNGVTFKEYGMRPIDLGFIEGRNITKEEIFAAFGQSLALWDKQTTKANAEAAQIMHARHTIKPRCLRNSSKLNEKLTPQFDKYLFLAFDDPCPEDRLVALRERAENIRTGVTTINEERKKMRMRPIEGGDEPLVQVQYLPLSAIISGAAIAKPSNELKPVSEIGDNGDNKD